MSRLLLTVGLVGLLGCNNEKAPECVDNGQCPEGNACVQNACEEVSCLTSAECDINQFCNPFYECEGGCETSDDCTAGETCKDHVCDVYGCRSTNLDCEYGEYCDTSSGECKTSSKPHCESCDAAATSSCGSNATCYIWEVDDGTCTGDRDCEDGWYCDNIESATSKNCHQDFCVVDCDPDDENACPRGFTCQDATGLGAYGCIADCSFMIENGYL